MTLPLLTMSEAALALNVPVGWLRKKVSSGAVPHTRLGKHVRFTQDHLAEIVADGETAVVGRPMPSSGVSMRARRAV